MMNFIVFQWVPYKGLRLFSKVYREFKQKKMLINCLFEQTLTVCVTSLALADLTIRLIV